MFFQFAFDSPNLNVIGFKFLVSVSNSVLFSPVDAFDCENFSHMNSDFDKQRSIFACIIDKNILFYFEALK